MEDTTTREPESEAPAAGEAEATPRRRAFSIAGRLAGLMAVVLLLFAGLVVAGWQLTPLAGGLVVLLAFALTLPLVVWGASVLLDPLSRTLGGLSDGIRSFEDRDFSVRIPTERDDELGELVRLYNRVGETLQEERSQVRQRELLLQAALEQSPIAIVLVNALDRVVYENHEARRLFMGGERLRGRNFGEILEGCPEALREVLASETDGIFTVDVEGEPETYHVAQRHFFLNRRRHTLYLLRRMTVELARQEAEIWKKVIRIISHELNNSLAPISSLAHSGKLIASRPDQVHRLESIYDSIRERVDHLTSFLEAYAKYARLPKPARQAVNWARWLDGLRKVSAFDLVGEPPGDPGHFDPAQLEQVMLNLFKNAREASEGEPAISVRVERLPDGASRVQVLDRGRGMSEDVMRQALLPFYSTKASGGGVGLPLCREIVEAHGGALRIQGRPDGGTVVSFRLPAGPSSR
jgi:nitrogen fixation/metabolism regulation signal transduction histidine kinase